MAKHEEDFFDIEGRDKYVQRFFGSLKQSPNDIKEEYISAISGNLKKGTNTILDEEDRYSAVFQGGEKTYYLNHFAEDAGTYVTEKQEISYMDESLFVNLGERIFTSNKGQEVTYSGFAVTEDGESVEFSPTVAEGMYNETMAKVDEIARNSSVSAIPEEAQ